jgi:predicted enzyme related to lactoylglutathione lyase
MLSEAGFATLVPIKNMDRAIKFYTNTLGGSLNMRGEGGMKDYWASVNVGRTESWMVKPEKHEKRNLAYSAFVVKDIKQTVARLKSKGVKFIRAEMDHDSKIDGPIVFTPYGGSAIFKDSEGNLSMIWENKIPFPTK